MNMAAVDTVFEQLGSMTVLELVELKNKIEEEWGITAAGPVAVAAAPRARGGAPGGPRRRRRCAGRRGEDGVRRRPHRRGPAEDPGDQGRARDHRPRAEGGEGPRRRRAERRQGGRRPRGGRLGQGAARGGRRLRRDQVAPGSDMCRWASSAATTGAFPLAGLDSGAYSSARPPAAPVALR